MIGLLCDSCGQHKAAKIVTFDHGPSFTVCDGCAMADPQWSPRDCQIFDLVGNQLGVMLDDSPA